MAFGPSPDVHQMHSVQYASGGACVCVVYTTHVVHSVYMCLCRFKQTRLNPEQDPAENMPAVVAAYNVGGMAAFWTGTTLRQQPSLERSPLICDEEWEELYSEADAVLKTSSQLFDFSIRHSVVADTLRQLYSDPAEKLSVETAPYAGQRDPHCTSHILWTGVDDILGEKLVEMLHDSKQTAFQLKVSSPAIHDLHNPCLFASVKSSQLFRHLVAFNHLLYEGSSFADCAY